ncbi:FAD-dependent oxidoreductase [Ponticoccus sp. SC2-23]|uniref:NAD(P)/FAD-dependent oxidoreductase n=1 Tax=Alexandriicola marinus TaxID=2081710 RepID=UPI000FDBFBC6|nr:FAD-dependent oxidoreductase [Alexandriicola marinus]MBM1221915.1 FAD-dependent oxidoreductase [Ponticoccus sp. SC6-9]MBM1226266.1 FAD-dependent oxidoreductase [Ponticoccus sp. SC6-15]MBM1230862.1 FAD-dependent oxidoreductase [Ponticoccus sp. SC6-38]MBM1235297.1 FAD-dependent oxidoreductase [Ponticoccus sp. SC6-45]MBM1239884.1 FAD-dependent oxidoreductase [Ponticoccus sp. SC6-49]MBM1244028.1 FAD-dependent oxidoreductase [Ponticoccus sp. SC2-64]MBM1248821.1 FAD-dependent oxidoreductase [Po
MSHFVVVGAGQAGSSLVAKLRSSGFDGKITLVGAEDVPPYQRPPLSKAYLLGEMEEERLYLRPESYYAEHGIELKLSTRAVGIDPVDRILTLEAGEEPIHYDALALTTGSHPRTLPAAIGGDLDGVMTMRDLRDADGMAPELVAGRKVLIVGGGYIGLEAAAVCAKKGLEVTLVEAADRILQRVAAPETSAFFRDLHGSHGVKILEKTGLERLLGEDRVTGARLTTGEEIATDFVVVGVGIEPATILAASAGLSVENGIETDSHCRTSDPHIWAAGDCASCLFEGRRIRLESVGNAIDMAEVAALNMMGQETEYAPKPWFWSDQYDCKLQIAGLNAGYDAIHVRDSGAGARSHWYYRQGRLIAVDAMNDSRAYMVGKRLIESGKSPAPEAVSDPATDLKALLKA